MKTITTHLYKEIQYFSFVKYRKLPKYFAISFFLQELLFPFFHTPVATCCVAADSKYYS